MSYVYQECDLVDFSFCVIRGIVFGDFVASIKRSWGNGHDGVSGFELVVLNGLKFPCIPMGLITVNLTQDEENFHKHDDFLKKGEKDILINLDEDDLCLTVFHPHHPKAIFMLDEYQKSKDQLGKNVWMYHPPSYKWGIRRV